MMALDDRLLQVPPPGTVMIDAQGRLTQQGYDFFLALARAIPRTRTAVGAYAVTAPLAANQVIPLVTLPKGARVLDVVLAADDLDGGEALTLDVGDVADPDRYIAASTVARAGGVARASSGILHRYAATDLITVKVRSAPAMGLTSGAIKLIVFYD